MFRHIVYESRLNSFKVVVNIPFNTPIYPLITPISGTNTRGDLRGLLICFSMLSQQYMLTFSACYEFVPGLYEF